MKKAREPIEVWFRVVKDKEGYPKSQDWEQLWGVPTEKGLRIESIPFFVKGIARGDLVRTKDTKNATFEFDCVVKRGGHSTFRIWLSEQLETKSERFKEELKTLGCESEITLGRLIAIDVPSQKLKVVREVLAEGVRLRRWVLEEGFVNSRP